MLCKLPFKQQGQILKCIKRFQLRSLNVVSQGEKATTNTNFTLPRAYQQGTAAVSAGSSTSLQDRLNQDHVTFRCVKFQQPASSTFWPFSCYFCNKLSFLSYRDYQEELDILVPWEQRVTRYRGKTSPAIYLTWGSGWGKRTSFTERATKPRKV